MTVQDSKLHQINLNVDNDAALHFEHKFVKSKLNIITGANQIIWGYSLLTQVYPTYGGEVQQILGARIETLTITGQTRDNHQLEQIYDFFRAYMTVASGFGHGKAGARSEQPIVFSYPARKWQFAIQVLEAPDFKIGTGLVATPWTIKAHIVPTGYDQQQLLSKIATSPLTSVLIPSTGIPVGIGYLADNPFSDAAYGGLDLAASGKTIGSNFQRLIGAWSVGDFAHFAFDGSAPSAYNALNTDSKDYWTSLYGTDFIATGTVNQDGTGAQAGGSPGGVGDGQYKQGSTVYPGDNASKEDLAAWMASNAIKRGIPPLLPVMAALTESHLTNLPGGDRDSKGFFQMRTSVWDTGQYAGYGTDPELQIQWFLDQAVATKGDHPVAAQPDAGAEKLGTWCADIERPQEEYRGRYQTHWAEAKNYIQHLLIEGSGGAAVTPTTGTVRAKAVGWANWMLANTKQISYSQAGQRVYLTPPALPFSSDCSASCINAYNWAIAQTPGTTAQPMSSGFTGTMVTRLTHISAQQASPGDMVVVGSGDGHHAVMLLNKVGNDWNCFSHGGPAGPHTTPLSYYLSRDSITYLRWPGNIDA